jgi:flagellar hook-associated protein 3 FlgL
MSASLSSPIRAVSPLGYEWVLSSSLGEFEDGDVPKVVLDLQWEQVAYAASLNATARSTPRSLLDFLR